MLERKDAGRGRNGSQPPSSLDGWGCQFQGQIFPLGTQHGPSTNFPGERPGRIPNCFEFSAPSPWISLMRLTQSVFLSDPSEWKRFHSPCCKGAVRSRTFFVGVGRLSTGLLPPRGVRFPCSRRLSNGHRTRDAELPLGRLCRMGIAARAEGRASMANSCSYRKAATSRVAASDAWCQSGLNYPDALRAEGRTSRSTLPA